VIVNSTLPTVHQAARNQQAGADNRVDRMSLWLLNVESMFTQCVTFVHPVHAIFPEVVADARQNFASSNVSLLPPLPVAPGPQTRRPSRDRSQDDLSRLTRPSRRALHANRILQGEEDSNTDRSFASSSSPVRDDRQGVVPTDILPGVPRGEHSRPIFSHDSPRPTRRATVLGHSPEKSGVLDIHVDLTPSKRREKSKSANDLKRLIRPISKVQFELDKRKSFVV
jgi:serine/threonine-protein kinase GIN4